MKEKNPGRIKNMTVSIKVKKISWPWRKHFHAQLQIMISHTCKLMIKKDID